MDWYDQDKIFTYIIYLIIFLALIKVLKYLFRIIKENHILKKLSASGIKDIDKMDGYQFEVYLKSLLKEMGYSASVTSGSHDYGADLIIKKGGKKIVVQAKRYGFKNKIGIDAIQQVYSAVPYYKANDAWVMTNSIFTKNAINLAKACDVNLIDRNKLINFINKVNPDMTAKSVIDNVSPLKRTCPLCKNKLIKRTSKNNNHFMGCETYPQCKHTEPIAKD